MPATQRQTAYTSPRRPGILDRADGGTGLRRGDVDYGVTQAVLDGLHVSRIEGDVAEPIAGPAPK